MGCGPARRDVRGGSRHRRRRPGDVGALRFRRVARAGPRRRAPDGRAGPRPASHARAARLGACHPAAPLHAHERGVGDGATPVRHAARGHGFRGVAPAHPRPAGCLPRPYCPASASKGAGQERFGRTDEMTRVEKGIVTAVVSAIVATGLAAQQPPVVPQAPLQVTLQEAVRRALDVQPAMVQARGDQRNAGASSRSAFGAFLPTVTTGASAARSNVGRIDPTTGRPVPPDYSYTGSLNLSLQLFDGFQRFANLKAASATSNAAEAGAVNQKFQITLATKQAFYNAIANEELVRVADAQVRRAQQQLQISIDTLHAGSATRSDSLRSTVAYGNARIALLQAQANLATAEANLGRQIGVDALVRAIPDTTLPAVPDTADLRRTALESSPAVEQAQAQASAARAQVWSVRAQYWPS